MRNTPDVDPRMANETDKSRNNAIVEPSCRKLNFAEAAARFSTGHVTIIKHHVRYCTVGPGNRYLIPR
jgi:hypothetical protein